MHFAKMVYHEGLEPPTFGSGNQRAIQLRQWYIQFIISQSLNCGKQEPKVNGVPENAQRKWGFGEA